MNRTSWALSADPGRIIVIICLVMPPDLERVAAYIRETADIDIMPRYRKLAAHEVIEKKPGDIVTIADREAEARLNRMLRGLTPGALVVGEEGSIRYTVERWARPNWSGRRPITKIPW